MTTPAKEGIHWGGREGDTRETQCRLSCSGLTPDDNSLTCTCKYMSVNSHRCLKMTWIVIIIEQERHSMSSLLLCDNPRWQFTDMYLKTWDLIWQYGNMDIWNSMWKYDTQCRLSCFGLTHDDNSLTCSCKYEKDWQARYNKMWKYVMIYEKICQDMKISLAPWCPSQKMLFQIKYVGALVILVWGCKAKVHLSSYFMKIQILLIDLSLGINTTIFVTRQIFMTQNLFNFRNHVNDWLGGGARATN